MLRRILSCTIPLLVLAAMPAFAQVEFVGGSETVQVDILPGQCPNRIDILGERQIGLIAPARATNPGIEVAIAGTEVFDVSSLDPKSLRLEGVAPKSFAYGDVITGDLPLEHSCDCIVSGADGYQDLILTFDRQELMTAMAPIENDQAQLLEFSAQSKSGSQMYGADCLTIRNFLAGNPIDSKRQSQRLELQNYPNPFNAGTVIAFELGEGGDVSLVIYDVLGRQVRTLANAYHAPGTHEVTWDGTDRSGAPVASGMYFYRLVSAGSAVTRRMVLLR